MRAADVARRTCDRTTLVGGRGEARGIDREINLNGLERAAALVDQRAENRCQGRVFESVEYRVMARQLGDVSALVGFPKVTHGATCRSRRIDLEHGGKHGISERQARTTALLLGLGQAATQVAEQHQELVLLVRLRRVVGGPVLARGRALGVAILGGLTWGEIGTVTAGGAAICLFIAALIGIRRSRTSATLQPIGNFGGTTMFRTPGGQLIGFDSAGGTFYATLDPRQQNRVTFGVVETLGKNPMTVMFTEREVDKWSR